MTTMTALMAMAALAWAGDTRADSVRKLETMKVSVNFEDVRLPDAVDFLRDLTGLNLVLLPKALEKDGESKIHLKVKDLSVKSILKLLLSSRGLTVTWRDGALVIVPKEDLQDSTAMKMFDVRSMMVKLQDFAGPKVELASSTGQNGLKDIGGVFSLVEPAPPPLDEDMMITLIKENTGGGSWDNNPKAAITMTNGVLVVSQTPAVLREIEGLIGLLGQYR
jgi:type II secretory pathway component GspD/PulD (secretin)